MRLILLNKSVVQHTPDVEHNKRTMLVISVNEFPAPGSNDNCWVVVCNAAARPIFGKQPRSPAMRPCVGCRKVVDGNDVVAIAVKAFCVFVVFDEI